MARTYFYETRYCAQDILIEFEIEHGEDNYDNPGHICDGGGSGNAIIVHKVDSELGAMLYNSRQLEKWEEDINDKHGGADYDDYDDF